MIDVYIDDKIGLTVDIPGSDNDVRLERALLLAIHAAARPLHSDEPIPRENMAALGKLIAEAGLEETKVILGWFFDFRRLLVSLPENKYVAWSSNIKDILKRGTTTAKEMETLIGRLVNVGAIMSPIYHFLS